ncbi:MAG: anaerobic sulfatase maturase [Candidatus Brocadiae bacterium]|nr:anaerobic sulfatase maturase [Candidatus Brocadiia bacterium]
MKKSNLGILLKPASHDCNMACDYCYYRPVNRLYPDVERPRMSPEVFDAVCEQYRELEPSEIKVGWQGGEPTLMGLDFFRQVVQIESRHARPGDCFGNSLQTNGVVLNDEWCGFLAANKFLVGLSVDGPPDLNVMRHFANGEPAFDVTMRALQLLKKHGVEFNILVVVSKANVGHPRRVFQFLVDNDLHYSQFIPCTEPAGQPGRVSEHSITAPQYADFMTALFDAWVEKDDPSYYIRRIDNWLHQSFGLPPECCEYRGDCSNLLTIEWNGDVYPCDFYVEGRFYMGSVRDKTLEQMLRGPVFREFVKRAHKLPPVCKDCEWLSYCHGGCYRHREKLGIASEGIPYLCEAKKRIFSHVFNALEELKRKPVRPHLHAFLNQIEEDVNAERFGRGATPSELSPTHAQAGRVPGRNDPCPCGSGKKFKNCCGKSVRAVP